MERGRSYRRSPEAYIICLCGKWTSFSCWELQKHFIFSTEEDCLLHYRCSGTSLGLKLVRQHPDHTYYNTTANLRSLSISIFSNLSKPWLSALPCPHKLSNLLSRQLAVSIDVPGLAGMELIFFIATSMRMCFEYVAKEMLITQECSGYGWAALAHCQGFLFFSLCPPSK